VLQRTRRAAVIHRTTDVLNGRLVTVGVSWTDPVRRLRGDAVVTVMQTADFGNGDDATG
jgi:hypothetical protein